MYTSHFFSECLKNAVVCRICVVDWPYAYLMSKFVNHVYFFRLQNFSTVVSKKLLKMVFAFHFSSFQSLIVLWGFVQPVFLNFYHCHHLDFFALLRVISETVFQLLPLSELGCLPFCWVIVAPSSFLSHYLCFRISLNQLNYWTQFCFALLFCIFFGWLN